MLHCMVPFHSIDLPVFVPAGGRVIKTDDVALMDGWMAATRSECCSTIALPLQLPMSVVGFFFTGCSGMSEPFN